ncbi:hypothetical protein [Nocardia acidivorans]|uniref:hypothetical protein n=1 Tax=Nocardia acidivorans TaxID=404580 RepID=UPI001C3F9FF3|nr:hypothetical protein [Nocardia acidivorans]
MGSNPTGGTYSIYNSRARPIAGRFCCCGIGVADDRGRLGDVGDVVGGQRDGDGGAGGVVVQLN